MTLRLPTRSRDQDEPGDLAITAADAGPVSPDALEDDAEEFMSIGDRLRKLLLSSGQNEPLYPRLLRLRNIHPSGWQRAALVEGMAVLGVLAALADKATSWAPVILPVAAAVVVKFHDVLVGVLPGRSDLAQDAERRRHP
jgi:hypothetical protein